MSHARAAADLASNRRTVHLISPPRRVSLFDVWTSVFPALDSLYRCFRHDGLLVAAAFAGRLHNHLFVPLGEDTAFALVGRHTACDLRLPGDAAVSLRHLLVAARRASGELRLRLCDLGTGLGVLTEHGMSCHALSAEGAAFVTVGEYQLFLLPTGSLAPLPWGDTATDAWLAIPERIYLDQRAGTPRPPAPPVSLVHPRSSRRSISTLIIDPPSALRGRCPPAGDRGTTLGQLEIEVCGRSECYAVHAADLEQGLLIGRYHRCAFSSDDQRLSRVHLALLRDGGSLFAVDTASSNGTRVAEARIRQLRLDGPAELNLAETIRLRWQPVNTIG